MGEVIVLSSDDEDIGLTPNAISLYDDIVTVPGKPGRRPVPAHALSDSESDEENTVSLKPPFNLSDDDLPDVQQISHYKEIETGIECSDLDLRSANHLASRKASSTANDLKVNCIKVSKKAEKDVEERLKKTMKAKEKREEKKKEKVYLQALKQASAEVERSKKPSDCAKHITCLLDPGLLSCDCSGEVLAALGSAGLQHRLEEAVVPCSIAWERTVHSVHTDDKSRMVQRKEMIQREEFILLVWTWEKFIDLVQEGSLQATVRGIKSLYPIHKITVIIYGLEDYFRFQKIRKRRDVRSKVLGTDSKKPTEKEVPFSNAGQFSRGDVELVLTDLQVLFGVCHRTINSKTELANIVCQFTKAIAEAPFKRENPASTEKLDWFASADSLKGVAVDKDCKGLFRLWQQQLCQFNLASIETSEAILSVYPSPLSLLKAYQRCSTIKEAELLLQDIPVRRGPGPLSSTRRIGPQLSKKIHKFFSSADGDEPII